MKQVLLDLYLDTTKVIDILNTNFKYGIEVISIDKFSKVVDDFFYLMDKNPHSKLILSDSIANGLLINDKLPLITVSFYKYIEEPYILIISLNQNEAFLEFNDQTCSKSDIKQAFKNFIQSLDDEDMHMSFSYISENNVYGAMLSLSYIDFKNKIK